jgi:hypothetical protein
MGQKRPAPKGLHSEAPWQRRSTCTGQTSPRCVLLLPTGLLKAITVVQICCNTLYCGTMALAFCAWRKATAC